MQKRTNPLALKPDTPLERPIEPVEALVAQPVAEPVAEPIIEPAQQEMVAPPAEETAAPVVEPVAEPAPKTVKEPRRPKPVVPKRPTVKRIVEQEPVAAPVSNEPEVPAFEVEQAPHAPAQSVRWERVTPRVAEPEPEEIAVPAVEPVAAPAIEEVYQDEDILGEETELAPDESAENEMAAVSNEYENEADISDEDEPLTPEDYAMAAKFAMTGRVSRGLKACKVSRDVVRLARLMHPEKTLSQVVEDALLTRIFLENPEAFDAMVVMLGKQGGRIKC